MQPFIDRAFKEWAVVCAALGAGQQTIVLRKGGLRDPDGAFTLETAEFALLPTYEHQRAELVRPEHRAALEASQSAFARANGVTIAHVASAEALGAIADPARLAALAPEHIWTEQAVRLRIAHRAPDPVTVVMLRVYRLPEPVRMPFAPQYGGCRSWATLEHAVATAGAEPVLAEAEFAKRKGALTALLAS